MEEVANKICNAFPVYADKYVLSGGRISIKLFNGGDFSVTGIRLTVRFFDDDRAVDTITVSLDKLLFAPGTSRMTDIAAPKCTSALITVDSVLSGEYEYLNEDGIKVVYGKERHVYGKVKSEYVVGSKIKRYLLIMIVVTFALFIAAFAVLTVSGVLPQLKTIFSEVDAWSIRALSML